MPLLTWQCQYWDPSNCFLLVFIFCNSFLSIFTIDKDEPKDSGNLIINDWAKFLVAKFEFAGSFSMSLDGDFHKVESTPYFELLVTFVMSLEGVGHDLYT
jgi:hypothetical protein